jgi:hypothetical protein
MIVMSRQSSNKLALSSLSIRSVMIFMPRFLILVVASSLLVWISWQQTITMNDDRSQRLSSKAISPKHNNETHDWIQQQSTNSPIVAQNVVKLQIPSNALNEQSIPDTATKTNTIVESDNNMPSLLDHKNDNLMDIAMLQKLIRRVRGNDHRLVRWDASSYTKRQQQSGGACDDLDKVWRLLQQPLPPMDQQQQQQEYIRRGLACEYATFCITDNPRHRSSMHNHSGLYENIAHLVQYYIPTPSTLSNITYPPPYAHQYYTSAVAAHLIYIATFADFMNHQGFITAHAVSALAQLLYNTSNINLEASSSTSVRSTKMKVNNATVQPIQIMWAAAALQNLAASYCMTEDDGRCYWEWKKTKKSKKYTLQIGKTSLPQISDGSVARRQIFLDSFLMQQVQYWTCPGPMVQNRSVLPGTNAVAWDPWLRHEESPLIVPWATTGVLKNVALEVSHNSLVKGILEGTIMCLCRLTFSSDWLEENKGTGALEHIRATGIPCWNLPHPSHSSKKKLCVDDEYWDAERYTCADYASATPRECSIPNHNSVTPSTACCGCGGGTWEQ